MAKKRILEENKEQNKNDSKITVKILSLESGLKQYDNIDFIRITSEDYNLLIMKDYLPVIGEIKGKIEFQNSDKESLKLENIVAYYMSSHNEFKLFIKQTERR